MPEFTCIVVTPEETALDQQVEFVVLPLFDGEMGIGHNHSPLIGRLGYGELRIRQGGRTTRYYVDGGFVQVAGNVVSVLTNRAVPVEKVEGDKAREQRAAAMKRPANTPELLEIRERLVAQARAQERMAGHK